MVSYRLKNYSNDIIKLLVVCFVLLLSCPLVQAGSIESREDPNDPNAWFPDAPRYHDPEGDVLLPRGDVGDVWVIDNGTHILFKVNLAGPFNETSESLVGVGISISNTTGSDQEGLLNIPIDYSIALTSSSLGIDMEFQDFNNATNTLQDAHLSENAWWTTLEDNHTLIFGYKLNTYHLNGTGEVGLLNLSSEQVLNIQFVGVALPNWWDFVPDQGSTWITYVMGQEPACPSCGGGKRQEPTCPSCEGGTEDFVIIGIILVAIVALGTAIAVAAKRHQHPYRKVVASMREDLKKFD